MKKLLPGDPIFYRAGDGRKYRGRVADTLSLKSKGEDLLIPVIKRTGKIVHWIKRGEIRKAPRSNQGGGKI